MSTEQPIPIVALTSLSPDPAQAARQRKCVASWLAAGCSRVLAFQSPGELAQLGDWPGVEFVGVSPSKAWGKFIPVSRLTTWAAQHPEVGHALLINSDIEVEASADTLQALAREAGPGMVYMHRHETNGLPFIGGMDAFLFPATSAHVVPESEVLVLARPHWDYVVPLAFARAGLPVCCPTWRVLYHQTHAVVSCSVPDWQRTCTEAERIHGGPVTLQEVIKITRYMGGASDRARTEAEVALLFGQAVWPPPAPRPSSIVALTSLAPDPKQADRQRACVKSWLAAGCSRVVAVQTADEIAKLKALGGWGDLEFIPSAPSKEWEGQFIPIDRAAQWATTYATDSAAAGVDAHVLLLNSDVALECDSATLRSLAREAGEGLCYLHRHESADGSRGAGVDGFLMRAARANVIPQSELLCFGRTYWDWILPMLFLKAHLPIASPSFRLLGHETHPARYSDADHRRAEAEAIRLLGYAPIAYADFASKTRAIEPAAPPTRTALHMYGG